MQNAKAKRLTACIMSILIPVFVLVSAFFIAAETDHDCCGEDCHVCACMQLCENIISGIANGLAVKAAAVLPVIIVLSCVLVTAFSFAGDTPVSQKVRLNN